MFSDHFNLLSFMAVITLLTISPGADTVMTIRNTLRGGRLDGWFTTVAICSGLFVHATASALGMAALLQASPDAFVWLQWAGAAYLAWLGYQSLHASFQSYDTEQVSGAQGQLVISRSLREGFLSNVLNPKTMVVYLALLPQFIDPRAAWVQSMVLAGLHFALSVVWLGVIVLLVQKARRWLVSRSIRGWVDRVVGISLLALAWVLIG